MNPKDYSQMMGYLTRPAMARGGRIGFYAGERVVESHGKQIKDLTEAGETAVSIAKKLKLKRTTVTNAINAMDKGIAGEEFKLSKPLKDIVKKKGPSTRTDLRFENLTRKENAKRLKIPTTNALGFRGLPNYKNITYTDYRDKKTGKKFRTYGVRITRQDKKATTAATTRSGFSNIPTLKKAIKVRDQFRKENPLNIKPADPEKEKITKATRRDFIKAQGGVEDFLTGDRGSGIQKGHAGDIKTRKITPSSIIYTPEEINVGMAGQEGVKGAKEIFTDLDYKISVAENEIEKIKKSNISPKEKRRLLDIQDRLLTDYHFQSGGFKTPTLSDGTVFGESTRKAMSMDQFDLFPNMTEKETRDFIRQYINKEGTLKPFYQRQVDSGEISEIDKANIRKSKLFLENVELAKQNVKNFDVAALKRLAAIGCGKAMGGRIGFFEGQNLNICAFKGIQKLQTTDPKNLTLADRANYQAIRKTTSGARALKNVLGPGALAIEGLFAAPFAAYDYARGRPGIDIAKSALSLGLLDQKLTTDELKKIYPEYGAGENIEKIGERLTNLERLQKGTRGQRIRNQGKINIANDQYENALQQLEKTDAFKQTGDYTKAYFENIKKSKDAEQELQRQYDIRKQGRTMQFDLSDPFMAAGGGIAKLAGVDSGPPPASGPNSQGLPGLLKRVKKL